MSETGGLRNGAVKRADVEESIWVGNVRGGWREDEGSETMGRGGNRARPLSGGCCGCPGEGRYGLLFGVPLMDIGGFCPASRAELALLLPLAPAVTSAPNSRLRFSSFSLFFLSSNSFITIFIFDLSSSNTTFISSSPTTPTIRPSPAVPNFFPFSFSKHALASRCVANLILAIPSEAPVVRSIAGS